MILSINRKFIFVILSLVCSIAAVAQQSARLQYQYDASGNRTGRSVIAPRSPQPSVSHPSLTVEVTVSPTVTDDIATISTTIDTEGSPMWYVLSSLQGGILATGNITGQRTDVSLKHLVGGVYLLTVHSKDFSRTFKLFRQ